MKKTILLGFVFLICLVPALANFDAYNFYDNFDDNTLNGSLWEQVNEDTAPGEVFTEEDQMLKVLGGDYSTTFKLNRSLNYSALNIDTDIGFRYSTSDGTVFPGGDHSKIYFELFATNSFDSKDGYNDTVVRVIIGKNSVSFRHYSGGVLLDSHSELHGFDNDDLGSYQGLSLLVNENFIEVTYINKTFEYFISNPVEGNILGFIAPWYASSSNYGFYLRDLNITLTDKYDHEYQGVVNETQNTTYQLNFINKSLNESHEHKAWLYWNKTKHNATLINNSSNNTVFNFSFEVPLVESNYSAREIFWEYDIGLDNGSTYKENTTSSTQRVLWSYFVSSTDISASVIENENQILSFNVTDYYGKANRSAYGFNYNGTFYSASEDTDHYSTLYQPNSLIETTSNQTNVTISSLINFTFKNVTFQRNYTQQQTVFTYYLYNCSNGESLNFSLKDEDSEELVNGDFEAAFDVWYGNSILKRNHSFDITNSSNVKICKLPQNYNLTIDSTLQFTADGYDIKNYYIKDLKITNQSQNIDLYLSNTTETSIITFHVSDQLDNPIENVLIKVLKYKPGQNTFKSVESVLTDYAGETIAHLVPFETEYKFLLEYNNETIKETTKSVITATDIYFTINLQDNFLDQYDDFDAVQGILTYDNDTGEIEFTYSNLQGSMEQGCLEINQLTTFNNYTYFEQCSESTAATINASIPVAFNGSFIINGVIIDAEGDSWLVDSISLTNQGSWETYGLGGILIALILIGTLSFIGLYNPTVAITFTLLGLIASFALGIAPITWATLITFIIIGGILIFKQKT